MKAVLKSNQLYIIPFFIFLIAGFILLRLNTKAQLHLDFNAYHNHFFDVFFFYTTHLGDGNMALIAFIILLVTKYRYALLIGCSNLIASLLTQLFKHYAFEDAPRPKKFFEGLHELHFIPGVDNHLHHSFPSGHATCAFALYFSIALIVKNNTLKLTLFFISLIAAYSRVYLSQHFFVDIYWGAFIGVFVTLGVYLWINKQNAPWLERSLIQTLRKQQ